MSNASHHSLALLTKCKTLKTLKQIHASLVKTGLHSDPFFAGKLILHCAVTISDALQYAHRLFLHFPNPDIFMYNTLIRGFSESGIPRNSIFTFIDMRRKSMVPPDSFSFAFVLKAAANYGSFRAGIQLHSQALVYGFDTHLFVGTTLISMYGECGSVYFAKKVFEQMLDPNIVAWNAISTACFRCGDVKGAREMFDIMPFKNLTSSNVMLAGSGNVEMTRLVFESMPDRKSVVSWTSMIEGLAMHGYAEEAIQVFHEMEESGIRPDGVTFVSILYACSHGGLIEQGCSYFFKMKDVYDIEPTIEHYGCMVDLYGRAGYLQKAYDFVCKMPIPPNAIIWRTLLGACSIHGNIELAEQIKERLSKLEPYDSGDNVLLSNIYAVAGKWKDVASVRRSMADQKIKKTPGWSMIEVDRIMYSFVAGEKSNKTTAEAYEKLKEIMWRLRVEGGYVPEVTSVLHDLEEEEKEDSVSKHSEKLAVAFGISRLCKGTVIRIVKNLRICGDCHKVMKLISK
ncbi:hypothetical protein COLO4_28317, partial [Corchorus olitorius]